MKLLRNAIILGALICAPLNGLAQEETADRNGELMEFIDAHTYALQLEGTTLSGAGANWFQETTKSTDFFMFGESHASGTIANIATAMFRALEANGFKHAAIEVDPWVGAQVEKLVRDEDPEAYANFLATEYNLLTVPFYSWQEEAEFLRAVIATNGDAAPALINLDQAFIGASKFLFEQLHDLSTTDEQRAAAEIHVQKSTEAFMHLGSADPAELVALRPLYSDATNGARELLDAIILSNQIYGPFVRGVGSVFEANTLRENYMKALLTGHFRRFENEGGVPKIFFKFGANHVFRGRSPTNIYALGNFIMEYAHLTQKETFNIHVMCAEGAVREVLSGEEATCSSYYLPQNSALIETTDGHDLAVVDLRQLRTSRLLRELDDKSQNLVWSYDALLVVKNSAPAHFYEGTLPSMPQ